MSDQPEAVDLSETYRVETTVRRLDEHGRVLSETTTLVITRNKVDSDEHTGMYL